MPRISRLMALAIRFEELLENGTAADYADLARMGKVSRARMTQIMNLLNLAPDIQESLLFLPPVRSSRDAISERTCRPVVEEALETPVFSKKMCLWWSGKSSIPCAINFEVFWDGRISGTVLGRDGQPASGMITTAIRTPGNPLFGKLWVGRPTSRQQSSP